MRFESVHHPGPTRRAALAVQTQARFVGVVLVVVMVILTGLFAVRDVLKLEPAEVFR